MPSSISSAASECRCNGPMRSTSSGSVRIVAVLLATATTLARPVLIALLSGVSIFLSAVATVLLQGVAFWLFSRVPGGLEIDRFGAAVLGALTYSLGSAVLTACLSIGDDNAFFGTLARRLAVHHRGVGRTDRPGVVVIQIDGLSRSFLEQQIDAGRVPVLSRWIRSREMTLDSWETLLPSQTSASQAGILHGNNDGIPAFRWWDKRTGRLLVSNHPADAKEIMRRVSRGDGLLANGGASIGNLLSGDATRSYLTTATIEDPARELRRSHVLDWFFISPYSYVRWIVLIDRRGLQGDRPGSPRTDHRTGTSRRTRFPVSARASGDERPVAPSDDRPRHRGDVSRGTNHLRRLRRLRRDRSPRRPRPGGGSRRHRRGGQDHRPDSEGGGRYAAAVSLHRPVRSRPESGRELPAAQ